MDQKYYIVRADRAGVFFGHIKERNGDEVVMTEVRRIWYWNGAASISQLAMEGVKYPAQAFFDWHHRLTGSCEAGRKAFAADHGIDLENGEYTMQEFLELTKDAYGYDVIRMVIKKMEGATL